MPTATTPTTPISMMVAEVLVPLGGEDIARSTRCSTSKESARERERAQCSESAKLCTVDSVLKIATRVVYVMHSSSHPFQRRSRRSRQRGRAACRPHDDADERIAVDRPSQSVRPRLATSLRASSRGNRCTAAPPSLFGITHQPPQEWSHQHLHRYPRRLAHSKANVGFAVLGPGRA